MKIKMQSLLILFFCFVLVIVPISLSGCSNKHDIYNIKTDLGDSLSIKAYLTGNLHGLYLAYDISGEGLEGLAYFYLRDEYLTEIPEGLVDSFAEIGSYGNTNFYTLQNEIIYVYDDERIDLLSSVYDLDAYKSDIECHDDEYMSKRRAAISDIIKSGLFDYIYRYGEILAYEKDEDMKQLLQRYAEGNFSDEELSVNDDSAKTPREMMLWAQGLLNQYFSS